PPAGTAITTAIRPAPATNDHAPAQPLCRISSNRFAGSFLRLQAGAGYSIRLSSPAFASDQFLAVTTRVDVVAAATNRALHVAVAGNDAADGLTTGTAWRTVAHALATAVTGDCVLIHGGRYYEGDLTAPRSGTPSSPIVFRNAPGEQPVLDGTDTNFIPAWTLYDAVNHIWRSPCTAQPDNAYLNGLQFFRYVNLSDLVSDTWSQGSGFHVDGAYCYARFPGGIAPGTNVFTIPAFTTGITLDNVAHLQFIGIEFCYFGYETYHRGIYMDGADSNLVDRCVFHHNGVGVAIKRAADFNTIQHCFFTESPVTTWSWHAIKEGGVGYEAGGVYVYGSSQANQGNVIRNNTFRDLFDGGHLYSEDLAGPTKNMDFCGNFLSGCGDDGIETDGAGVNNRIYDNVFTNFLTGISVAPCAIGPTYIFRNVLAGWHNAEEFEGYPFKFNVSSSLTIDWVHLYHNTCFTDVPGQDGFLFKNYSGWTNIVSRNNVYAGTDYAIESWPATNPVSFDYDALYTTNGSRLARWGGVNYATRAAFSGGTGQEAHAVTGAPRLVSTPAGGFRPAPDSPLIDRGVVIPGVNDGYAGIAPDIGAFEFEPEVVGFFPEGEGLVSRWSVVSGSTYAVQISTDAVLSSWADLAGAFSATGFNVSVVHSSPVPARAAYRVQTR
ncbi:MAG: hypothetical protein BWK77_06775, partial [Verrucomicrobia bacterium A1]